MKKIILKVLCVFFAVLLFGMQTFAFSLKTSSPISKSEIQSVVEFDESEVYAAFAGITDLDQYLALNIGKTYSEVSQDNNALLTGVSSTTSLPLSVSPGELALGIPSWIWGCSFGIIGVLIVYLVTEDKDQMKKALYGCIAGTVVGVAVYVVIIAGLIGATAASTNTYTY